MRWIDVELVKTNDGELELQVACHEATVPEAAARAIGALLASRMWPDLIEIEIPPATDRQFWQDFIKEQHLDALAKIQSGDLTVVDYLNRFVDENDPFRRKGYGQLGNLFLDWFDPVRGQLQGLLWLNLKYTFLELANLEGKTIDRRPENVDPEWWLRAYEEDALEPEDLLKPRRVGRPTQASGRGMGRGYGQGGKRVAGTKLDRLAAERRRHSGETGADDW